MLWWGVGAEDGLPSVIGSFSGLWKLVSSLRSGADLLDPSIMVMARRSPELSKVWRDTYELMSVGDWYSTSLSLL